MSHRYPTTSTNTTTTTTTTNNKNTHHQRSSEQPDRPLKEPCVNPICTSKKEKNKRCHKSYCSVCCYAELEKDPNYHCPDHFYRFRGRKQNGHSAHGNNTSIVSTSKNSSSNQLVVVAAAVNDDSDDESHNNHDGEILSNTIVSPSLDTQRGTSKRKEPPIGNSMRPSKKKYTTPSEKNLDGSGCREDNERITISSLDNIEINHLSFDSNQGPELSKSKQYLYESMLDDNTDEIKLTIRSQHGSTTRSISSLLTGSSSSSSGSTQKSLEDFFLNVFGTHVPPHEIMAALKMTIQAHQTLKKSIHDAYMGMDHYSDKSFIVPKWELATSPPPHTEPK